MVSIPSWLMVFFTINASITITFALLKLVFWSVDFSFWLEDVRNAVKKVNNG